MRNKQKGGLVWRFACTCGRTLDVATPETKADAARIYARRVAQDTLGWVSAPTARTKTKCGWLPSPHHDDPLCCSSNCSMDLLVTWDVTRTVRYTAWLEHAGIRTDEPGAWRAAAQLPDPRARDIAIRCLEWLDDLQDADELREAS